MLENKKVGVKPNFKDTDKGVAYGIYLGEHRGVHHIQCEVNTKVIYEYSAHTHEVYALEWLDKAVKVKINDLVIKGTVVEETKKNITIKQIDGTLTIVDKVNLAITLLSLVEKLVLEVKKIIRAIKGG